MKTLHRLALLCCAAAALCACGLSRESRLEAPSSSPAQQSFQALLSAARRFDDQALERLVSERFEGGRAQLLASVRADKRRFLSADVSVQQFREQKIDGGVLLEFSFLGRAMAKSDPDSLLKGRAQWVLREEDGALKLFSARGDALLGLSPGR